MMLFRLSNRALSLGLTSSNTFDSSSLSAVSTNPFEKGADLGSGDIVFDGLVQLDRLRIHDNGTNEDFTRHGQVNYDSP